MIVVIVLMTTVMMMRMLTMAIMVNVACATTYCFLLATWKNLLLLAITCLISNC